MSFVGLLMATAALATANPGAPSGAKGGGAGEAAPATSDVISDVQQNPLATSPYSGVLFGKSLRLNGSTGTKVAQVGDVLGGGVKKKAGAAAGEEAEAQLNPFRGSTVIYRNSTTAVSFNPDGATVHTPNGDVQGRYNPTYVMTLRLLPSYWINEYFGLWGDAWFGGELTHSDWTRERMYMIIDPSLGARGTYTIPVINVGVTGSFAFNFPASLGSQAAGKYLGLTGDLSASYAMPFLPALRVGLGVGGQKDFHEYTTNSASASLNCSGAQSIAGGSEAVIGATACGADLPGAYYNVDYTLWISSFVGYGITDWLSAGLSFLYIHQQRYNAASSFLTTNGVTNPAGSDPILFWNFGVTATPHPMVSVRLGAQSIHHLLDPNGKYQVPLFNRSAQFFLDVIFNAGELYTLFRDMGDQA